jgi:hypothetical protein
LIRSQQAQRFRTPSALPQSINIGVDCACHQPRRPGDGELGLVPAAPHGAG